MSRETSVVRGALKAISDENTGMAVAEVGGTVVVTMLAGKDGVWVSLRRKSADSPSQELAKLCVSAPSKPWLPVEFSFETFTDDCEQEIVHRNTITAQPFAKGRSDESIHRIVPPWPRAVDTD